LENGTTLKNLIVSNNIEQTMPTVVRMATVEARIKPIRMTVSTLLRARKFGLMRKKASKNPHSASSIASDVAPMRL
jgi:hypothetical protein